MYAICPTDPEGHRKFLTLVSVSEQWTADENGQLLERKALVHGDSEGDPYAPWHCEICDAEALTGEGDRPATLRAARLDHYRESYADDYMRQENTVGGGRFLLIERNVRGSNPPYWMTSFESTDEAGRYHATQEYADDWDVELLVDLDTGEEFAGQTKTHKETTWSALR